MQSPISGKEMKLTKERRSIDFRKETFEVVFHYYKCEDSGEQFTTTALDEVNMNQVYNQYRDRFNIPFPDEIIRIREKYGLSAAKMSEVLGFGVNSYRQYEAGEMPSVANAKLIQMVYEPKNFIEMVELCTTIDDKTKAKLIQKARLLAEEKKRNIFNLNFKEYLLGNHLADIYSGYRNPNFEKLTEMVIYFSEKLSPFKTKMNKLLFYADFLMFKQSCFSISGVRYKAIDMGPVPNNFQSIFEYLANKNEIDISTTEFPQGYTGEKFIAREERPFNPDLFTENELNTLEKVATVFKDTSTIDIIKLSHLEEAWKNNEKGKSVISYEYAFELNQI
ncbi:type II TA system antitoxin MqsA family protein [Natronoflexus pectinivorans]|uniref:Putative zinc finger/helix-turn-helix YgiT family protein n=1 Tax=Natronoflexus pectinivorans TaxID=682526 RepID=A0A4R2GFE7_9BACT|nr:type II TA system antitoxin MqsA family protein [Natronoflexus pectinivorans]TCO06907.1 putative zinc finger/helix-turn-helix YgiT family protein [Natronoflexus pectinivorans]